MASSLSTTSTKHCAVVNVKGQIFNIPFIKLTNREPESLLSHLIRDQWKPSTGCRQIVITRSPTLFQFIVGYLNEGATARWPQDPQVLDQLMKEADFFKLHGMIPILWRLLNNVPLITLKLEVGFEVCFNPGVLNLYWQAVAVMTYCYAPRRNAAQFQVVGFIKSKYQLKNSSWWCFDVSCPSCAGFDFAPMEDRVDFEAVETVMKKKMEQAKGKLMKICQNQCALVEWDVGWKFHLPLSALLQYNTYV